MAEPVRKHDNGTLTLHRGRTFVGYWRVAYFGRRPTFDAIIYPKGRDPVEIKSLFAVNLRAEIAKRTEAEGWEFPPHAVPPRPSEFRKP